MTIIKEIRLSWLTDEEIKKLSFGEVKNSKTFNNNFEPEIGGLFCPQIFGPLQSSQFSEQGKNSGIFASSKIRRW
jgi:DNA-directed RNA polymerase beta' subunit